MGFFKRYPIFCVVLVLLVLALGAGVYLVISQQAKVEDAKESYENQVRRLQEVSRGVLYNSETGQRVAPTKANRELLQVRLDQVDGDLERIRSGMVARTDRILNDSADEFTFLPKLQSFIASLKALAAKNHVILQSDEAFGFAKYATQAAQPKKEMIPMLNRQRQVLDYILKQLMASEPVSILAVEREFVERPPEEENSRNRGRNSNSNSNTKEDDVFTIQELVTARSNEFIETSAFRIVFTGRTNALREFLNRLGKFELPLIVRSVEVVPATESDVPKQAEAPKQNSSENALFALFGGGDEEEAEVEVTEETDPNKKPVITETESKFTVVIEYVEVNIDSDDETEEAGS